ncbi:ribose-5-phosphate isomerase [Arachidicoccus rhizosphaerae]|uniref:Ribose-5-phosphate isomerase A n=1 Tax=Arachidicoccus rhizosphaerae TaxID=551991 RepID=A0A1H3VMA6_9BACT|nr:ribose-5-phosphate isomerase RpiA [Arachidicoccus rhizosphaerae]SDZ75915.1 ribose-5-phosphate isomerase [Arachidicoccus rhizosphaerae]
MNAKQLAAEAAVALIKDGMKVGLGTGSTAYFAIQKIGQRVKDEGLKVTCIATSVQSEELATSLNIPMAGFEELSYLDITIDGADEADHSLQLIKGGGGALLREKIIAYMTGHYVIIADDSKYVETLGKFFLPVEVIPFGWQRTFDHLSRLGCTPHLREKQGAAYITDNGNYILDCDFKKITDPGQLQTELNLIPGVVECGLFVDRAQTLIIAAADGQLTTYHKEVKN